MADLIQSENLEQLTVEIKFYVNQWGQNTIEIGKRLIAAKKLVEHGDWSKWLEDNFNLSHNAANKFMKCAERFANCSTSNNLNSSQMFESSHFLRRKLKNLSRRKKLKIILLRI